MTLGALVASCLFAAPQAAVADDGLAVALDGVVVVHTTTGTGAAVVAAPGRLLTAAHVVDASATVSLQPSHGSARTAAVVRRDTASDLAILEADTAGLPVLTLRSSPVSVGEDVYAAGAALDSPSVSRGVISGRRVVHGVSHLQTDAAVNPGNSGGPLLDERLEVVGLVVAKLTDAEGIGLAVPADRLRALLDGAPTTSPTAGTGAIDVRLPQAGAPRDAGVPTSAVVVLIVVLVGGALLVTLNLGSRHHRGKTPGSGDSTGPRPVPMPPPVDDDLVIVLHSVSDRPSQET